MTFKPDAYTQLGYTPTQAQYLKTIAPGWLAEAITQTFGQLDTSTMAATLYVLNRWHWFTNPAKAQTWLAAYKTVNPTATPATLIQACEDQANSYNLVGQPPTEPPAPANRRILTHIKATLPGCAAKKLTEHWQDDWNQHTQHAM